MVGIKTKLLKLEKNTNRRDGGLLSAVIGRTATGAYSLACCLWDGKRRGGGRHIMSEHETEQEALTAADTAADRHSVRKAVIIYGEYDLS